MPRAVREQQMLDAAVQMFSVNGYHETSMDAIAAQAEISKPMLYLYYGSKEELFGACLDRELTPVRRRRSAPTSTSSRAQKTCCATPFWRS